nr:O-antigen ligase family protein [Propionibacterium sp.]
MTGMGRRLVLAVGAVVLVVLGLGIGYLAPAHPELALGAAAAVLMLGITAAEPAAIPLVAFPLLVVVYRVEAAGVDLSLSDVVLALATLTALVFAPRPFHPALRNLLWLNAAYQFATLFTVLVNPYQANVVEWFHAWMLVSGALIVGWTVGRQGFARSALTLFLLACLAIAAVTVVQAAAQWARGDFGPVYVSWPYAMHKNFVGTLLGFAAVVVYARPGWLGWTQGWARSALALFAVAMLFTQSRQAIIALGVALVIVAFRDRRQRQRWSLVLLGVVPALALVATLVRDQVQSGNQFNSVFQRLNWFGDTVEVWAASPWVGQGLRFWTTGRTAVAFQPPNAELEVLASAGVIGLAAFLLLMVGTLRQLWRLAPAYGTLGVAAVASRLVQSQLDLFWITIQVSVPFALVGVAIGALARDELAASPWQTASGTRPGAAPVAAGGRIAA